MPEPPALAVGLASVTGYLLGSIPTARWVGARYGIDPLVSGERNPGAANVWALAGRRAGVAVLAVDIGKGAIAALAGLALGGWWAACSAVVFAMAGHAWPVWTRFRGGRSVACLVGGGIVLAPAAFVIAAAVFGVVLAAGLWRAAAIGILAYPVLFAVLVTDRWRLIGLGFAYLVLALAWLSAQRRQRVSS